MSQLFCHDDWLSIHDKFYLEPKICVLHTLPIPVMTLPPQAFTKLRNSIKNIGVLVKMCSCPSLYKLSNRLYKIIISGINQSAMYLHNGICITHKEENCTVCKKVSETEDHM